jgi:alkylated DNA repair dioxygenase AlkB
MSINFKDIYKEKQNIPIPDGALTYWPDFLTDAAATEIFESLKMLPWKQNHVRIFNKWHLTPRLESLHGIEQTTYSYSGQTLETTPFTPLLSAIKSQVEACTQQEFNVVLVNYYRNGQDSNGWHADNEPELGKNPVIASLSLGAERRFDIKHIHSGQKLQLMLENGSLLLMSGTMQHFWKHQIAKTKKVEEGRINLTFRKIVK